MIDQYRDDGLSSSTVCPKSLLLLPTHMAQENAFLQRGPMMSLNVDSLLSVLFIITICIIDDRKWNDSLPLEEIVIFPDGCIAH